MQTAPVGRWFSSDRDCVRSRTAEMKEALQHSVDAMQEALIRWDLTVNWKKSIVMYVMYVARKSTIMTVNTCQRALDLGEESSRVHA